MSDSTTIQPFPELRALAEEEARAFAGAWAGASHSSWQEWNVLNPETRDRRILAHLTLLCDLSRPASRDAVARLVAARVGLGCGATAPELRRFRMGRPDGTESLAYALLGSPGEQFFFVDGNVPGVSAVTDPAEALALIVHHLWPAEPTDAR